MFQRFGKETNERLWGEELRDVTEVLTSAPAGGPAASHALGVIQARAAVAAAEAARSTRLLAIATFVLAGVTFLLAVIDVFK
jgi:hypothetical protein